MIKEKLLSASQKQNVLYQAVYQDAGLSLVIRWSRLLIEAQEFE